MKIKNSQLLISAVSPAQFPSADLPEIALAGRSNVGKSSLINRLIQRKNFAHTSSQPGKTQTLNFYQVNEAFNLVDVPGYGYARVSKKQREKFGQMYETYLSTRQQLRGAIILIDSRHEPSDDDQTMLNYLRYFQQPLLIVATKIDKLSRNRRVGQLPHLAKSLNLHSNETILPFSATENTGRQEIWQWIEVQIQSDSE